MLISDVFWSSPGTSIFRNSGSPAKNTQPRLPSRLSFRFLWTMVVHNGQSLSWTNVYAGVPQVIYIKDLADDLYSNGKRFVDHTSFFSVVHNVIASTRKLNNDLEKTRSSRAEVFLRKGVLKMCCRFTGKRPYRSGILIKLQSNFIGITLRHGSSLVYLLHIFRTTFTENTSGWLLLKD